MSELILAMEAITKEFPGVKALDNVNLNVRRGEIHGLVGENGAGKSTLMNILSGVFPHGDYSGDVSVDGEPVRFKDIRHSEEAGIVIIHQELALIAELSIAENIFLGNERATGGVVDWSATNIEALRLMERVGLQEDPQNLVAGIGVGKQQLVEIAKALSKKVKLLILDEPTAALNLTDSANLLRLLEELRDQGITSILITHKLQEVLAVADTVTILRDGRTIETMDLADGSVDEDRIIRGMVGRDLAHRFPPREHEIGEVFFEVINWNVHHPENVDRRIVHDADIEIRRGEVVGLAGLMGAGRTEFAMSIFGRAYGARISGQLIKDGRPLALHTVADAIDHGIAYVTEDRKQYGLLLDEDVRRNMTLAKLDRISTRGVVDSHREVVEAERLREQLNVKTPTVFQRTQHLSGGNQQKVVLSKWVFSQPDLLILDEPTRGIDVGAKYEIYLIIQRLAAEGKGVLVISSELPELLGLCDRIYAMSAGRITGQAAREEATEEKMMRLMTIESNGTVPS